MTAPTTDPVSAQTVGTLLTDEDIRPGTRIRYRSGAWATITDVDKPETPGKDWRVKVWDDAWPVVGSVDGGEWAPRWYLMKIKAVVGHPADDPDPDIHAPWTATAGRSAE